MKFLLISFALIAACSAVILAPDQEIPIVQQLQDINPDGSYSYNYETGNGIIGQEAGVGGRYAQGASQWTSPEGIPVQISYLADENGYQPQGDLLPVAPAIPEAIIRALEWISAHPPEEEGLRFKRQVGSDPCTYGPSYWCASQANAVKCNTIQYCKDNVW